MSDNTTEGMAAHLVAAVNCRPLLQPVCMYVCFSGTQISNPFGDESFDTVNHVNDRASRSSWLYLGLRTCAWWATGKSRTFGPPLSLWLHPDYNCTFEGLHERAMLSLLSSDIDYSKIKWLTRTSKENWMKMTRHRLCIIGCHVAARNTGCLCRQLY